MSVLSRCNSSHVYMAVIGAQRIQFLSRRRHVKQHDVLGRRSEVTVPAGVD